jgi:hypothetical protein
MGGRGVRTGVRRLVAAAVAVGLAVTVAACGAQPERGTARPAPGGVGAAGARALAVSADGRHLVDATGAPFFWLGDTAWALTNNLDRAEVEHYLDTRAEQGFTVIQTVAVFPQAGGDAPNRQGDRPHHGSLDRLAVTEGADPGDDEQYDFWDHLDFVLAEAAERDLRIALLPVWADQQVGELLTEENAAAFGEFLGARYADDDVIWVMGGDESADDVEDVWRELARGVAIGVTGREDYSTTLMTYHPIGDESSVEWFHDDEWLDLNMVQGGHCLRYDVRQELVEEAHGAEPTKPFLDGEPIYEEHPYCWKPEDGYSTPVDVRRDAYWSVFAGALGHTYGHHSVWQFASDARPAVLNARSDWTDALGHEAAGQMRHLRALMESRPWWTGRPDDEVVTSDAGSAPARLQATRAEDGAYAMVYSPDGAPFEADLSAIPGGQAQAWWFDPRTGAATDAGRVPAAEGSFTPPSPQDWVLVADDPARGFPAPGSAPVPAAAAAAMPVGAAAARARPDPG